MDTIDCLLLSLIILIFLGFLTPILPLLFVCGRVVTKAQALRRISSGNGFITYNTEMGIMHRVWISDKPITTHLRGIRQGRIVWMPWASVETVQKIFRRRHTIVSRAGWWHLDKEIGDGRTLFDSIWEFKQRMAEEEDARDDSSSTARVEGK